ncbi:MAG TPA: PVC-type heme-binding CxxCH protein [Tepidisphaeraceae bacterium]|nr:PVC-type heme-binding CxxCH protein [Tepidisphaeraceae bacterium]
MPIASLSSRALALCLLALPAFAQPAKNPFAEAVRTTEPLTAEQQLKTFKLPEGFTIQLVAHEPDLHKPINIAVDAKGRLWVTSSIEYPWAVKADAPGKPRDAIKVMEIDPATGRATKVTTFADGLNIPAGVYPYKDGAIAFSIPNIYHFRDTDGDGVADKRDVLYGPFDTSRDTHGMTNSFTLGFDGWLYATHGFNNQSKIAGKDGHAIEMKSGHVYRMALDGSRVELLTRGPVNPFGLAFDPLGNLFVADCHTKPIQQVIRGAWFEHFGRPHDGIGFYPKIMGHLHGSTGIAGVVSLEDDRWPAEFRGNLICGNPVTSRVNRDAIDWKGSTPTLVEKPDFVESADPWFRPVAFALSPDGSLYVADFYNRIIGHYEVPLTHPGRDRERGRIWRIVPPPVNADARRAWPSDLSKATAGQLAECLDHPSLITRKLAADELVDRVGKEAVEPVRKQLASASARARAGALWVLERLGEATERQILIAAADPDPLVRTHAVRMLGERAGDWSAVARSTAKTLLSDAGPLVRRSAVEAIARHPSAAGVYDLTHLVETTPPADTHLVYAARLALRECLTAGGLDFVNRARKVPSPAEVRTIASVCVAIPTPEAATFLLNAVRGNHVDPGVMGDAVKHLVRHAPADQMDGLVALCRQRDPNNADGQLALFKSVKDGAAARGAALTPAAREWGAQVAKTALAPGKKLSSQRTVAAAEVARDLKLAAAQEDLARVLADASADAQSRGACADALLKIDPAAHVQRVVAIVADAKQATSLRESLARAVADVNTDEARQSLLMPIRTASHAAGVRLAVALASRPEGANVLLESIERKTLLPRLLMEAPVRDKLNAAKIKDLDARIAALTKDLPPASADLDKAIAIRRAQFTAGKASATRGKDVYAKSCAVCHQLDGQGATVGPQLDGVGARGLDRILEDVIDPNRNVDPMFRYVNVTTKDGDIVSGLPRREEGQSLVLIDSTGKEITINKAQIQSREPSKLSLMPTGFHEAVKPGEFNDLLAFLLSKTAEAPN